jgi:hypothetical protein
MCTEEQSADVDPADVLRAVIVTARQKQKLMETLFPTMNPTTRRQAAASMAFQAVLEQYPYDLLQRLLRSFSDGDEQLAVERMAQILAMTDGTSSH